MKKQIVLLASLLALSSQALADDSITEPIPCELEEGRAMVDAMVSEEGGATWKESFRSAGKKLKSELEGILANTNNAAFSTDYEEVQVLLRKASCIREVGTGMQVTDEFMAKYKAYDKEISSRSGHNFLRMPAVPKTDAETNQVNNFRLLYYNRDAFAFVRALFE